METIGASPFGTSFYDPHPIIDSDGLRHHFRIRRTTLNWRAEAMVQRLQLISWSINNVVGALRCLTGGLPGTIRFCRPEDPAIFDTAWQWHVGVHASDFDSVVAGDQIDPIPRAELKAELEQRADKALHVSPFCAVEGSYRFRFMVDPQRAHTVARIDYDDDAGLLLHTSVSGELEPFTRAAMRRALLRYPAMTLGVIGRIHWQALKLWCKRVRFLRKPPPPDAFLTR